MTFDWFKECLLRVCDQMNKEEFMSAEHPERKRLKDVDTCQEIRSGIENPFETIDKEIQETLEEMKIFERTYMSDNSRENDPPREKHPSIERGDVTQKDLYGRKKLLEAKTIEKETEHEKSPPETPKRKPKKANTKSHKAASKKI